LQEGPQPIDSNDHAPIVGAIASTFDRRALTPQWSLSEVRFSARYWPAAGVGWLYHRTSQRHRPV